MNPNSIARRQQVLLRRTAAMVKNLTTDMDILADCNTTNALTISSLDAAEVTAGTLIRTHNGTLLITDRGDVKYGLTTYPAYKVAHFASLYRNTPQPSDSFGRSSKPLPELIRDDLPLCMDGDTFVAMAREVKHGDTLRVNDTSYHVLGTSFINRYVVHLITTVQQ